MMMFDYKTPVLTIYLIGLMSGEKLKETVGWRVQVRKHYEDWKNTGKPYPCRFIDPYAGPELTSIDPKGYTSNIPASAIVDGDMLSVKSADLLIANLDTFGGSRGPIGSYYELGAGLILNKPTIIICPDTNLQRHPFVKKASVIVNSVEELLEQKWINYFFKRFAGADYEIKFDN
jgi:hypothetical protein